MKMKISEKLFNKKEEIAILGSVKKSTNTVGPTGLGFSSKRPKSTKTAAKYSAVAKVLDAIFVDKRVNAICGEDMVYGEVTIDSNITKFVMKDNKISYESEKLHGSDALIPVVLFYLKNNNATDEFYDAFKTVKENVEEFDFAEVESVLKACDSFYYEHAKNLDEVDVLEDELAPEIIKRNVTTGVLGPMTILDDIIDLPSVSVAAIAKKAKAAKKKVVENTYADIMSGSSIIPYEWSEDQKLKIPKLSTLDNFIPVKTFYSLLKKITYRLGKVSLRMDSGMTGLDAIGKDYINVMINGKPGTGKTTMAYALGAATGMPVYTVTLSNGTEEDTFQGMNKVINGSLGFVETQCLEAYTHGGIIILEEVNLPNSAVIPGALGQAIEFPFILEKNGYEPVRRHPMCVIIATENIGTQGSKGVNEAFSSRLRQSYVMDDPKKEDFLKVLLQINPDKTLVNWVYNAYDKVIQYLKSPAVVADDICLRVTLRNCIGALENIEEGSDTPKEALKNTLIGKISEVDIELAEATYNDVIKSLPDLY